MIDHQKNIINFTAGHTGVVSLIYEFSYQTSAAEMWIHPLTERVED